MRRSYESQRRRSPLRSNNRRKEHELTTTTISRRNERFRDEDAAATVSSRRSSSYSPQETEHSEANNRTVQEEICKHINEPLPPTQEISPVKSAGVLINHPTPSSKLFEGMESVETAE